MSPLKPILESSEKKPDTSDITGGSASHVWIPTPGDIVTCSEHMYEHITSAHVNGSLLSYRGNMMSSNDEHFFPMLVIRVTMKLTSGVAQHNIVCLTGSGRLVERFIYVNRVSSEAICASFDDPGHINFCWTLITPQAQISISL